MAGCRSTRTSGTRSGWTVPIPPRKLDMAYARALERLLTRAQDLAQPHGPALSEILYLGDTMLNDGGAFLNLAHADWLARVVLHWRGERREA